ncbi:MAG: hypothetical protein PHU25_13525 [Deltaproteobacteria bacterium]|nr:hypothetical protein [Deltaproteobacteria bacterium]
MAVDRTAPFLGFTPDDFDAYLPDKWNSNMFTLPRRRVKDKLEQMGARLGEVLFGNGLALATHLSDEFPSLWNSKKVSTQWLFFSRDEAALGEFTDLIDKERTLAATLADPTPLYRQIFLGVAVTHEALEIGMRLHHDAWVDRENLMNQIAGPESRRRLQAVLAALPEHYEMGVTGETMCPGACADDAALERLVAAFGQGGAWFFAGARLPRDQVEVLGPDVLDTGIEVIDLMAPLYKCIAWSRDNDFISLDKLVAERHEILRASHEELDREQSEREAKRQEEETRRRKLREEVEERVRETQVWREREAAARRAAFRAAAQAREAEEARNRAEAAAAMWGRSQRAEPKPATSGGVEAHPDLPRPVSGKPVEACVKAVAPVKPERRKQEPEVVEEIRVGSRVEVVRGFLKGRQGVVQEIDDKGGIKVIFGALSSRLAREDVVGRRCVAR